MELNTVTADAGRDEFLQLLVTQLRNQDPLEPVAQQDFLAQLAQFSTLEGIEEMNSNFESLIALQEATVRLQSLSEASDLIGKRVTYQSSTDPADVREGVIEGALVGGSTLLLTIDGHTIPVQAVMGLGKVDGFGLR